ncbi:MAG: T9SS type A sorting domain-containing protein [Bacteroidota bacterium]
MKKILLNIFTLLLVSTGVFAQIEFSTGSIILEAEGVDQIFIDIRIVNNGAEATEIYWNYEPSENYPDNWKTQICDLNFCYDWDNLESLTNFPNMIDAGQEVTFTLKIKNNIDESLPVFGSSCGVMRLFNDSEKLNEVAATLCSTSLNDLSSEELMLYPNPTTEMFQIKNDASVASVRVYNIVGRLVKTIGHTAGMAHDVTDLRTGMYLVRLENKNGDVLKSMRLSKR